MKGVIICATYKAYLSCAAMYGFDVRKVNWLGNDLMKLAGRNDGFPVWVYEAPGITPTMELALQAAKGRGYQVFYLKERPGEDVKNEIPPAMGG